MTEFVRKNPRKIATVLAPVALMLFAFASLRAMFIAAALWYVLWPLWLAVEADPQ